MTQFGGNNPASKQTDKLTYSNILMNQIERICTLEAQGHVEEAGTSIETLRLLLRPYWTPEFMNWFKKSYIDLVTTLEPIRKDMQRQSSSPAGRRTTGHIQRMTDLNWTFRKELLSSLMMLLHQVGMMPEKEIEMDVLEL